MRAPKEIYEKYITVGVGKTKQGMLKVFVLAVLAGVFIALAGVASTFANNIVNKLCGSVVFCGGLSMVLVAGSELFTGNSLLIMPLLDKKITLSALIKNWITVYIGNFIGSVAVAFFAVSSGVLSSFSESVINTAVVKTSLSFSEALVRGILCNFLVCIAVWMSFSSDKTADKITAIIFPITFFVLSGFEHSIANMYFIPVGLLMSVKTGLSGSITVGGFLFKNLLPVTLGNLAGGILVGLAYRFIYGARHEKKVGLKSEDTCDMHV